MRGRVQAWVLGILVGTAGCAEIQEARKAQDPANARPGERTVTAAELGLVNDGVLTYDRGLEISLLHNPAIAIFRAQAEQALASLEEIDAAFYPQILLANANYKLEKAGGAHNGTLPLPAGSGPPGSPSPIGHSSIFQAQGGALSMSQLVYDFGRTPALSRQAFQTWAATEASLRSTVNDTVLGFKSAYFNVLKQEELIAVNQESVRDFQRHLDQTQVLVQVGLRQKYDLTKAQVDLGNAQLALVKARTALESGRATLNNVLGLAENPRYVLKRTEKPGQWSLSFEEAFARAQKENPHIISFVLQEVAARHGVDAAIASFYPTLSLNGSFSWAGPLTPTTWFSFLGPFLNYAIFTGWQVTGALHLSIANLRQAYAARAQAEQQLHLDLSNGYIQLENARESLKILTLQVKSATEQLELAQGRYLNGKASSVDLTDAEVALATAKGNEVEARWDLEIAIVTLERLVGVEGKKD
ncbi:MAG TPA: TolC family protein [Planctomycetota bacterium]|nr:TolC family protein [Planctomycetota bacterium]